MKLGARYRCRTSGPWDDMPFGWTSNIGVVVAVESQTGFAKLRFPGARCDWWVNPRRLSPVCPRRS